MQIGVRMLAHVTVLVVASATLLPMAWAVDTGRGPRFLAPHAHPTARRFRALGFLGLYAMALLITLPRLLDASPRIISACSIASGFAVVAAFSCAGAGGRADRSFGRY
ncbi:hypothetical protein [Yinghuangia soli]|uniref:Uncharacterized protein n=1 Tax=Yinghuangia soli TaxID=2908204 RepID=A0AA41Q4X9_9ACTN|nr:hypothetical protein [Yinghuangia soli]MCF2531634.1 hypothetical protein [Yinghuangia soli]